MTPLRSVVVTGLGVIAGPDCGVDALAETLRGSVMKTSRVDTGQGHHPPHASTQALLTRGVSLSTWISPAAARRMTQSSRLAVAAARMALAHAGLADEQGTATSAVVLSISFGAATSTERLLETARRDGPHAVSPFDFAESVANAAAGQVAIATGCRGPNLTIAQREAGTLTAVGRGAALITSRRADRVLAGTVDELPPILHASLGRFDALARPDETGEEVARPFDASRSGFVAAEGAVVLVLEAEDSARARGARCLGRIRGFGGAFDDTAPRIGWGTGHARLAKAIGRTLDSTGCRLDAITRIVSGASGAVAGDRLEALVVKTLWAGAPLPTVLAPKAHVGQYGGGFLAAAILSVAGGAFGPTRGFVREDPVLGIRPFEGGTLEPAPLSLVTTIGSGGSAAWLLLGAA